MLRSAPVSDFCKSSLFQKTSPESACPLERKDVNCFSKDKSCLNACFCLLINRNTSWPLHLCSHCRAASIKLNADYKPFQPHFKNTFTKKDKFLGCLLNLFSLFLPKKHNYQKIFCFILQIRFTEGTLNALSENAICLLVGSCSFCTLTNTIGYFCV